MIERVPEGWDFKRLGKLCSFSGGNAFKEIYQGQTTGDYPFIKVSDMNHLENRKFIMDYLNKDKIINQFKELIDE